MEIPNTTSAVRRPIARLDVSLTIGVTWLYREG